MLDKSIVLKQINYNIKYFKYFLEEEVVSEDDLYSLNGKKDAYLISLKIIEQEDNYYFALKKIKNLIDEIFVKITYEDNRLYLSGKLKAYADVIDILSEQKEWY